MDNLPWLDEVWRRLAAERLPPAYIQRLSEELADHLDDLKEESMSTEADAYSRMGEPEQVVESALVAYRRRSFLGTHPMAAFLVFAISPVMSLIVLVAAAVLGVGLLGTVYERLGYDLTEDAYRLGTIGSAMLNDMLSLLTIVIPSIVATAFYCHLGKRSNIGGKWVLVSSALLAVIASGACFWRAGAGSGEWCFGICWSGFLATGQWNCLLQHLVELIAPLAVAWWFLRRHRDEGYLQLSP